MFVLIIKPNGKAGKGLTDKIVIPIESVEGKVTIFEDWLQGSFFFSREENAQVQETLTKLGHIWSSKMTVRKELRI